MSYDFNANDVFEMAEQLGAGSVKFNIIQPTGRGETITDGDKGLDIKELIDLGRRIETETLAVGFQKFSP